MRMLKSQRGVTLIELLVTIAILGLVMAGIYGLLGSAYQTYMNTRRRIESQQSARTVLDYLTFRLREVQGSNRPEAPWECTKCHVVHTASSQAERDRIPCVMDVSSPLRTHAILKLDNSNLSTLRDLPSNVPGVPPKYAKTELEGTHLVFKADLLPLTGFSEKFTDSPRVLNGSINSLRNGTWDWKASSDVGGATDQGDSNGNDFYDAGETELLDDMNENGGLDYFGEVWGFRLRDSTTDNYYELIESVSFTLLSDRAKFNRSVYTGGDAATYDGYGFLHGDSSTDDVVVADGIVGYKIKIVPMAEGTELSSYGAGQSIDPLCAGGKCHGDTQGTSANKVYTGTGVFNMAIFLGYHSWWNIRGIRVEVTTASRKGPETHFTTLSEFIIPRNIEVNNR